MEAAFSLLEPSSILAHPYYARPPHIQAPPGITPEAAHFPVDISQIGISASSATVQSSLQPYAISTVANSPQTKPGMALNPLDWNLSKIIPPLGILSSLGWGISNIVEHQIQAGHAPKLNWLSKLGQKAPWLNLAYGSLNIVGAFAQGYSVRGVAFSSFTIFSALMTRLMLKDNQLSIKLAKHLGSQASEQVIKEARAGLKLREWTSLYNAVAPIGLLTGLFSITKVAQSAPDVTLEHPKANTLREMFLSAEAGENLPAILSRNFKKEWGSFQHTLTNSAHFAGKAVTDIKQAFLGLFGKNSEQENMSPAARFMDPLTSGQTVPLMYTQATVGRVLASTLAALMFWRASRSALLKESVYSKLIGDSVKNVGAQTVASGAKSQKAKWFDRGINLALLWGQLAGTAAGLLTKFNDWPLMLSMIYRTSGAAYGASAICSLMNLGKVKQLGPLFKEGKLLGFDERTWTKIGAFIQGTSYFVNLFIKNLKSEQTQASSKLEVPQPKKFA